MKEAMAEAAERFPKLGYPGRRKVAHLIRRRDYLQGLEDQGHTNDWDRAELGALVWTLDRLARATEAGL